MVISVLLTLVFSDSTSNRKFSPPTVNLVKVSAFFINVCFYTLHTYLAASISFISYYTDMVENYEYCVEKTLHKTCFCASLHNAVPLQRIVFEKLISQFDWRKSFILLTRNIQISPPELLYSGLYTVLII
jgi:hypothetical protein